jgi:hypothetical protein
MLSGKNSGCNEYLHCGSAKRGCVCILHVCFAMDGLVHSFGLHDGIWSSSTQYPCWLSNASGLQVHTFGGAVDRMYMPRTWGHTAGCGCCAWSCSNRIGRASGHVFCRVKHCCYASLSAHDLVVKPRDLP